MAHAPGHGYLHAADDDTPYDVDGVAYCGRCHVALSTSGEHVGVTPLRPTPTPAVIHAATTREGFRGAVNALFNVICNENGGKWSDELQAGMERILAKYNAAVSATPLVLDCIVYDTEIVRCIPDKGAARDPALQYCDGWHDFAGMGIAVICAVDLLTDDSHVFLADNLGAFAKLIEGRMVAGHSNEGFDNKVLAANGITPHRSFDLLLAIREAVGEPREYTRGVTKKGRTVNDLARVNLGVQKSADGALAPVVWQRGGIGEVIDYCLRDVTLEARLIRKMHALVDPVTGRELHLSLPAAT